MKSFDELFKATQVTVVASNIPSVPVKTGLGLERSPACGVLFDEHIIEGEAKYRKQKITYERVDPLDKTLFKGKLVDELIVAREEGPDSADTAEILSEWMDSRWSTALASAEGYEMPDAE